MKFGRYEVKGVNIIPDYEVLDDFYFNQYGTNEELYLYFFLNRTYMRYTQCDM